MKGKVLTNASVNRRALDFYPTPPEATHALLDFIELPAESKIWEPACGDGAMAEVFLSRGYRVHASDLRETGFGHGGVDFLAAPPTPGFDAIITNPPFAIALEFISRAIDQAPVVAMLLKSQYWHAQKRVSIFNQRPPAYVLPLTWRPDFMDGERGGAPTMDVLWTVWIRGETDTRYRQLLRPTK